MMESKTLNDDLFDEVLKDVITYEMAFTYIRFKESQLYKEMDSEKKVLSYFF